MATSSTSIFGHLAQFRSRLRTSGLSHGALGEELPLRSDLFSADEMERYGKALAAAHRLTPRRAPDQLLPRLAANESVLVGVFDRLTAAVSDNHRISPDGEWLLDNFHLIEEQIGTAKRHVSNMAVTSRQMRRLTLAHPVLTFIFNIAVLALGITSSPCSPTATTEESIECSRM